MDAGRVRAFGIFILPVWRFMLTHMGYDFAAIEAKWQTFWAQQRTFHAPNPGEAGFDPAQPKFYVLDMFPYPSGVGLHVGHPLGYIATDIVARYKRMKGFNVLHPMGYDAFGLPAEQFAVEQGVHPRITTENNIANMTRQLKALGLSYDWDRAISTTDEDYYRWTQWIFLQLFNCWFDPVLNKARPIAELEQKLASEQYYIGPEGDLIVAAEGLDAVAGTPVGAPQVARKYPRASAANCWTITAWRTWMRCRSTGARPWAPSWPTRKSPTTAGVSAATTRSISGRCGSGCCASPPMPNAWLAIWTLVDWPESIRIMQRNWIGRSEGARVEFPLAFDPKRGESVADETITVFTTRPDTLFGATYMVLAPEHPLVESLATSEQLHAVNEYQKQAAAKNDVDRQAETAAGQKTGVFTGAYAINPVNNQRIPIWIADYVMMGYGTGAIMAVPAHDERDFAFARQFGLPIQAVVQPEDAWFQHQAPQGAQPVEAETVRELREIYLCDPTQFHEAFSGEGVGVNSANSEVSLDGLPTAEAKKTITDWLKTRGLGKPMVQYKLRDWLFSRQRYWGEPFPILHGPDGQVVALRETELPVKLPEMDNFQPASSDDPNAPPLPPLARARGRLEVCHAPPAPRGFATRASSTPCRSGPGHAGITCASSTPATASGS